jgi:Na+/H+ antiporter NhaD/arsenite permease-like protein
MLGAGIIWVTIAYAAPDYGINHEQLRGAIFHDLEEYSTLMLFLMAAMTYIAALEDLDVFGALRSRLVGMGLNYRQVFWVTGTIAFFLSAVRGSSRSAWSTSFARPMRAVRSAPSATSRR